VRCEIVVKSSEDLLRDAAIVGSVMVGLQWKFVEEETSKFLNQSKNWVASHGYEHEFQFTSTKTSVTSTKTNLNLDNRREASKSFRSQSVWNVRKIEATFGSTFSL
jgi:hypothetical protein